MSKKPVETYTGSKKTNATRVFVAFVFLFSLVCITVMNRNYDSLSRYPYKDENSRQLIRKYLTPEQIDYIIEYSIAPNVFIAFIQEDEFNIYHASEYKKLSESEWQETPASIVKMVEETRDQMDTETLIHYLSNYSYDSLHAFLENGDPYQPNASLLLQPDRLETYLDASHTVSTRIPLSLTSLPEEVPVDQNREIVVDNTLSTPLMTLCTDIREDLNSSQACGGLTIIKGYVSYEDQEKLYADAVETYGEDQAVKYVSYPGHSEHQLGLAVDFEVAGIPALGFGKTEQSQWLALNAWKYGFVNTWNEYDADLTNHKAESTHYRFVGEELARTLKDSGLTFARYATSQEGNEQ